MFTASLVLRGEISSSARVLLPAAAVCLLRFHPEALQATCFVLPVAICEAAQLSWGSTGLFGPGCVTEKALARARLCWRLCRHQGPMVLGV